MTWVSLELRLPYPIVRRKYVSVIQVNAQFHDFRVNHLAIMEITPSKCNGGKSSLPTVVLSYLEVWNYFLNKNKTVSGKPRATSKGFHEGASFFRKLRTRSYDASVLFSIIIQQTGMNSLEGS